MPKIDALFDVLKSRAEHTSKSIVATFKMNALLEMLSRDYIIKYVEELKFPPQMTTEEKENIKFQILGFVAHIQNKLRRIN